MKQITTEMIDALEALRKFSTVTKATPGADALSKEAALAIDLLDNENFFTPITDTEKGSS